MSGRLRTIALALALALGAPGLARADGAADVAAARELFTHAAAAAKEGKWEEARGLYARALELKRSPAILYGLALAQANTGHVVDAIETYRAFLLEAKPDDPYRDTAKAQIAELEPRVARLEIAVSPASGVVVTVDGVAVPAAALGLPRRVDPGKHVVAARADGFEAASQEITLEAGKSGKVTLTLAASKARPLVPDPLPRPARDVRNFVPGGALLGAGAAVFAAGLGVGLSGVVDAGAAPTRDGPEAADARLRMNVGDVVGAVGAAAGLAGVAVLIYEAARPARAGRPGVGLAVGRGGLGVSF